MARLSYLEDCIRQGRVSDVASIRKKFSCCDKTARNLITELRDAGIRVHYSKALKKYVIIE